MRKCQAPLRYVPHGFDNTHKRRDKKLLQRADGLFIQMEADRFRFTTVYREQSMQNIYKIILVMSCPGIAFCMRPATACQPEDARNNYP